jgi:hypothetical protein
MVVLHTDIHPTTTTMTTFQVRPGGRTDYNDDYGQELIDRSQYRLYMGGGGATTHWPGKYRPTLFAGGTYPLRDYYLRRRPTIGDRLIMRLRDGRIFSGQVRTVTETIQLWKDIPSTWEWVHRTPAHKAGSEANWAAAIAANEFPQDYLLVLGVDWTECSNPTAEQTQWASTGTAAIQRRRTCPFP